MDSIEGEETSQRVDRATMLEVPHHRHLGECVGIGGGVCAWAKEEMDEWNKRREGELKMDEYQP